MKAYIKLFCEVIPLIVFFLVNSYDKVILKEIPLEGKVVVLAVDMLDAMKALETKLSVVPSHQFNLKPKLGQVEITDLVGYEEE